MRIMIIPLAALLVLASPSALPAAPATSPAKLWTSDLTTFRSERPGNWVVGRSNQPALSAAEAESLARDDAADAIVGMLRPRLSRPSDAARLHRHVRAALASGEWIGDRHVERNDRPYGTIWSASVLVNASPQRAERLVQQVEREAKQQRGRTAAGTTAAVVLVAVVAASYMLLNWLTRGFFRGRLALASALIVMTGVFGIVQLL